jgi:ribonuclease D
MNGKNKIIAVDCEAVNLGRNGRLCLVQVATATKPYLFGTLILLFCPFLLLTLKDIIEGGPALFDGGLRQLLEDNNIVKVMHDCRLGTFISLLFYEYYFINL